MNTPKITFTSEVEAQLAPGAYERLAEAARQHDAAQAWLQDQMRPHILAILAAQERMLLGAFTRAKDDVASLTPPDYVGSVGGAGRDQLTTETASGPTRPAPGT